MSRYWNARTRNLSPYVPGEQPRDGALVKLNTNENPYPPSPLAAEAARRALEEAGDAAAPEGFPLRLYPDPECRELREAAAARFRVRPEQVFAGNGSDEVLAFAFAAFFDSPPAHLVLFPDITYSFYPVYARLWGVPYREAPLKDDFSVDAADYLVPSGGAVLANPNSPTGRALPARDILAIADFLEHQAGDKKPVVIVDEAYAPFGAESVVPFIDAHPNLLTVHTLSKAWALAGLRVGLAIGNEALIAGLRRVRDSFNSYTLGRLAQAAGAAALSDSAYYDGITARITAERERVSAALTGRGFTVLPSKANFLFIKHPEMTGERFFAALRERGILARRFNTPRVADYLRVTIGDGRSMDAFLNACGETLARR
ncbi:MAG: histidinol-phosphate aminotransferase [Treponematales bacterium]